MANANAGLNNRYGTDLLAGYREGKVNVYGGGNINRFSWLNRSESKRKIVTGSDTLVTASKGSGRGGPVFGGGRAGGDIELGPRDKVGLSCRMRGFRTGGVCGSDATERRLPQNSVRHYTTEETWLWTGTALFGMADYEHGFDTSGQKLTGRLYLINRSGGSSGLRQEMEAKDTVYGRRNEQGRPWLRLTGELGYEKPALAGGKLESGYEGNLERTSDDMKQWQYDTAAHAYEPDTLSNHSNSGADQVHAAYATWSTEWRGLGIQPALRVEYEGRAVEVLDTDSTYLVNRWDAFPSLHLSYGLPANQQVSASYSRRVNRPSIWELDPFPNWQGPHSVYQGNPLLSPEFTDSWEAGYELSFGQNSVNAGLYYRVTRDLFQWVTMKYAPDTAALLTTPRNVGQDYSLGGEFSANLNPWKWLTLAPSADLYDYRVTGNLLGQDFARSSFAWSSSLSLTLRAPFGTQVQLDGNYTAPTVTSQGREGGWFDTDVAVRQMFLNRTLSVTLRIGHIFGGVPWRTESAGPGFSASSSYFHDERVVTLSISYNLNNFRPNPKMRAGEGEEMQGGPGR